jgi:hypothetical protein
MIIAFLIIDFLTLWIDKDSEDYAESQAYFAKMHLSGGYFLF